MCARPRYVLGLLVCLPFVGAAVACGGGGGGDGDDGGLSGLIAFVSTRDDVAGEIYTMRWDGTAVTRLTFNSVVDDAPRLSADGTQIVFMREVAGSPDIILPTMGISATLWSTGLSTGP